jgi:ribonuclease-3
VEKKLQLRFRQAHLLEQAFTHKSYTHETRGEAPHNESLEFLGDAVLGFLITDYIYRHHPELDEGHQSKIKAHLVSTITLARLAGELGLPEHLRLGKGEEKTGGRRKTALRANLLEAVVAAAYLDAGVDAARAFVERIYSGLLLPIKRGRTDLVDAKTALQEWLQGRGRPLAEYRVVGESGPEHKKTFHVDLFLEGQRIASAHGRTKKEAELAAARTALGRLFKQSAERD